MKKACRSQTTDGLTKVIRVRHLIWSRSGAEPDLARLIIPAASVRLTGRLSFGSTYDTFTHTKRIEHWIGGCFFDARPMQDIRVGMQQSMSQPARFDGEIGRLHPCSVTLANDTSEWIVRGSTYALASIPT